MTSRKSINDSWYKIGFNDGKNLPFKYIQIVYKDTNQQKGYRLGVIAGRKQRKEDTLIKLLKGNINEKD